MPTDDHQLVRQGGSQDSVGTPATGRGDRCQWGDPDAAKVPQPEDQIVVFHNRQVVKTANLLK